MISLFQTLFEKLYTTMKWKKKQKQPTEYKGGGRVIAVLFQMCRFYILSINRYLVLCVCIYIYTHAYA